MLKSLVLVLCCISFAFLPHGVSGAASLPAAVGPARLGPDLQPEGPVVPTATIRTSPTAGAGVIAAHKTFRVRFANTEGKPEVLFSFPAANISDRMGVACDIKNKGREPVRVFGELNENAWVAGYVVVPAGQVRRLYVFLQRKAFSPPQRKPPSKA